MHLPAPKREMTTRYGGRYRSLLGIVVCNVQAGASALAIAAIWRSRVTSTCGDLSHPLLRVQIPGSLAIAGNFQHLDGDCIFVTARHQQGELV
jgi:hypothetical protein